MDNLYNSAGFCRFTYNHLKICDMEWLKSLDRESLIQSYKRSFKIQLHNNKLGVLSRLQYWTEIQAALTWLFEVCMIQNQFMSTVWYLNQLNG